jgi:hypothetical protein
MAGRPWQEDCGTKATRLALNYGFQTLGHRNIMPAPLRRKDHHLSRLRAGFRVIGVRREHQRALARALDSVFMERLSTECEGSASTPGKLSMLQRGQKSE